MGSEGEEVVHCYNPQTGESREEIPELEEGSWIRNTASELRNDEDDTRKIRKVYLIKQNMAIRKNTYFPIT